MARTRQTARRGRGGRAPRLHVVRRTTPGGLRLGSSDAFDADDNRDDHALNVTSYDEDFAGYGDDVLGERSDDSDNASGGEDDQSTGGGGRWWGKKPREDDGDVTVRNVVFDFRRGKTRWPRGVEFVDEAEAEKLLKKAEEEANAANERLKEKGKVDDYDDMYETGAAAGMDPNYGPQFPGFGHLASKRYSDDDDSDDGIILENPKLSMAPAEAKFEVLKDKSTALVVQPGQRIKLDLRGLTEYGKTTIQRERKAELKAKIQEAKEKRDAELEAKGELSSSASGIPKPPKAPKGSRQGAKPSWRGGASAMRARAGAAGGGASSAAAAAIAQSRYAGIGSDDVFGDGLYSSLFKTMVNEYTVTMDIKLRHDIPRDGIALYQTALIHMEENPRTGRKKLKQSNGECVINSDGGVGILGAFGDNDARVEKGQWRRVVMSVKCIKDNKGQVRSWVDSVPAAILRHDEVVHDGRFAIDPEQLFLFSSSKPSMMPGDILLRYIKVEAKFSSDVDVLRARAEDKVISMFLEERQEEVDDQRKGLALSSLFPKPRPIWSAPALTATFGDAFLEGTALEGSSLIGWSYTVLRFTLNEALRKQKLYLGNMSRESRGAVSDVCHILGQSNVMMRQILKLLRHPNKSQLMSFLHKLRNQIEGLGVGESIVLPAIVEGREMIIIVIRTSDQRFRFVIVQTDPVTGLAHHPVNPINGPPKLKYRTCMVLSNISKKNAQDQVFWMAVYNLTIHNHAGDMTKFYDVLLPFLTGKPLESSLVEAERGAAKLEKGKPNADLGVAGPWRSPQRSETGHVRCLLEAINYLLLSRGLTKLEAKQIAIALRAQFVEMISNDMDFVTPNDNGQRVCRIACSQLGYSTVKLVDKLGSLRKHEKEMQKREKLIKKHQKQAGKTAAAAAAPGEDDVDEKSIAATEQSATDSKAEAKAKEEMEEFLSTLTEEERKELSKKSVESFRTYINKILERTKQLVDKVNKKLEACQNDEVELPPKLALDVPQTSSKNLLTDRAKMTSTAAGKVETAAANTTTESKAESSPTSSSGATTSTVVSSNGPQIEIKVKHNLPAGDKRPMMFNVSPEDKVSVLINLILERTGVPENLQRLVFMGRMLQADRTFASYKISKSGLVIHLATKSVPADVIKEQAEAEDSTSALSNLAKAKENAGAATAEDDGSNATAKESAKVQFQDLLAWDAPISIPDPGTITPLNKYVPIDFLQIPQTVTTREEAVRAIRYCDRLCTLLDNQDHCIANDKFLIASLIQHTFTHVVPVPKPRDLRLNADQLKIAGRRDRRNQRKREFWKDLTSGDKKKKATPGYIKVGKIVEAQYPGEVDIWYKAEIMKVDEEDKTVSVVFEDGEEFNDIPYPSIRAPRGAKSRRKVGGAAPPPDDGNEGMPGHGLFGGPGGGGLFGNSMPDQFQSGSLFGGGGLQGLTFHGTGFNFASGGGGNNNNNSGSDSSGDEGDDAATTKASKKLEDEAADAETSGKQDDQNEDTPNFKDGEEFMNRLLAEECIWDQDIGYELQLELVITLNRIQEHFVSAAFSLQQSRTFDGVSIVTAGAICAITDAIIRTRAYDVPSEISCHLRGETREGKKLGVFGYGIGVSTFAEQTENIEFHYAEVSQTRTAVLDYFQSPEQQKLHKIFAWETAYAVKPNKATMQFLRLVGRDIAWVDPISMVLADLRPDRSKLLKNYPELRAFRDLVFWWKYLLNPDVTTFPNYINTKKEDDTTQSRYTRLAGQLHWRWDQDEEAYIVGAFGNQLYCRPAPDRDASGQLFKSDRQPQSERYPSTATPSFYVPDPPIRSEDDVIYRPTLPGFEHSNGNSKGGSSAKIHVLGQHDSELLISYLTVPYLRLPLVLTFFSSDDRLHKLQSPKLRDILDSVMFEPGKYLRMDREGVCPIVVPTPRPELLATSYGMLINELQHSPDIVLKGVISLLEGALALDTGSVCDGDDSDFNTGVEIILYITRLGARVENYLAFLLDVTAGTHENIRTRLRGVEVTDDCREKLIQGRKRIMELLHGDFDELLSHYLRRLDDQTKKNPTDEDIIQRNSRLSCDLHAHKLLMHRNTSAKHMDLFCAKAIVSSFVYLTTRHTWNRMLREEGRLTIPETELYELLQHQRRNLVTFTSSRSQGDVDALMQSALQVSTSTTGSLSASADILDASNRWSRIKGARSHGRYAVASTRSAAAKDVSESTKTKKKGKLGSLFNKKKKTKPQLTRQVSENAVVEEVADDGQLGVEMDLQIGQMTLRSKHLSALIPEIANDPDVRLLFGTSNMQASQLEKATNCHRYRLVGMQHDLAYWHTPHHECPPLGDEWERDYDPSELFDSESWIPPIFEPLRRSFFNGPMPQAMQFLLPSWALPDDAEVAVILGLSQTIGGPFKLVYLFRRLKCAHVYQVISHGRQWWWTLHMTTDVRYCLRELQPYTGELRNPFPSWWKKGAGAPYPPNNNVPRFLYSTLSDSASSTSVVITREAAHHKNLSGGDEVFVPKRLLYGLIPQCLLEQYHFWRDASWVTERQSRFGLQQQPVRIIRGYPISDDLETMVIVELQKVGSILDVQRRPPASRNAFGDNGVEILGGLPGRTVRIKRVAMKDVKEYFQRRQEVAQVLESIPLLANAKDKERRKRKLARERKLAIEKAAANSETAQKLEENKEFASTKHVSRHDFVEIGSTVRYNIKNQNNVFAIVIAAYDNDTVFDIKFISGSAKGVILRRVDRRDLLPKTKIVYHNQDLGPLGWKGQDDSDDAIWDTTSEDDDNAFHKGSDSSDGEGEGRRKRNRLSYENFNQLGLLLEAASNDDKRLSEILYRLAAIPDNEYSSIAKLAQAVRLHVMLSDKANGSKSEVETAAKVAAATTPKSGEDRSDENSDLPAVKHTDPLEENAMVMLNLLYAPRRSGLHSLMKTLCRIENLSNIVAWTKASNLRDLNPSWVEQGDLSTAVASKASRSGTLLRGCPPVELVELPRLKLSFTTRRDHEGKLRLYSMDHADLFVSNERTELTSRMLAGIPHSLLMSNSEGETQVLVPVVPPRRPRIESQPFTTWLVMDRNDKEWFQELTQRYFLYPVHVSQSFLLTRGVESALYLMLLRFLQRNYPEVYRLSDSIATDTAYSKTGSTIFNAFRFAGDDWHPDAHACRLKISLVTLDSGMKLPWDLTSQFSRYTIKLPHIGAACRMSLEEELQILETEKAVVLDEKSSMYNKRIHNPYMCSIVKNRLYALRAILVDDSVDHEPDQPMKLLKDREEDTTAAAPLPSGSQPSARGTIVKASCFAPPRIPSSGWPYYTDNTVFGEKYAEVVEVQNMEEWDRQLRCRGSEDIGDSCKPSKGWLVVSCFHVLWNPASVEVMSALLELAPAFPSCIFLSVRADCIGMDQLARKLNVNTFPTFIMFRDGVELEGERITEDRATEPLVRFLADHLEDEDHQAYRRFVKEERRAAMGNTDDDAKPSGEKKKRSGSRRESNASAKSLKKEQGDPNDSDEEQFEQVDEEMQWTWDVEQCGSNYRVEGLGMAAILYGDEDDEPKAVWESAPMQVFGKSEGGERWEPFSPEVSASLEEQYTTGRLFINYNLENHIGRPFYVYQDNVKITTSFVSGMRLDYQTPPWESAKVRRRGMRKVVPGEPEVDPEQKLLDNRMAMFREHIAEQKRYAREKRRGKDIEAIRGTVGYVAHSGKHKWTIRWNHEPSRGGVGDGIGFSSESSETFGPSKAPCLGGEDDSASIGLYANGKVFHGDAVVAEAQLLPRKSMAQRLIALKKREEAFAAEIAKRKKALAELAAAKKGNAKGDKSPGASKNGTTAEDALAESTSESKVEDSPEGETSTDDNESDEKSEAVTSDESSKEKSDNDEVTTTKDNENDEGEKAKDGDEEETPNDEEGDQDEEPQPRPEAELDLLKIVQEKCANTPLGTLAAVELGKQETLWGQTSEVTVNLDTDVEDGVVTFEVDGVPIEGIRISGLFTMLGGGAVYPVVCMAPFDPEPEDDEAKKRQQEQLKLLRAGVKAQEESDRGARKARGKAAREAKLQDDDDAPADEGDAEMNNKAAEEDAAKKEAEEQLEQAVSAAWKVTQIDRDYLRELGVEKVNELCRVAQELVAIQPKQPTVLVIGRNDDALAMSMMEELQADAKESAPTNQQQPDDDYTDDSEYDSDEDENEPDEDNDTAGVDKDDNEADAVPLSSCVWMHETEKGWDPYSAEACKQIEMARRNGQKECEIYVNNEHLLIKFGKDAKSDSEQISGTGEGVSVRRHVVGDGMSGQWEMLSMYYRPPMALHGKAVVDVLEKVWRSEEDMLGRQCGFGFLFLYTLLQGQARCKVISTGWWDAFGYGGGYGGGGSSKSDSHRFAVLLSQLYVDRRKKSLPTSIVNVLIRNRQLCPRMRKFRDTRKVKRVHVFNGWVDDREPESPLATLMSNVVPALQDLRRRRGAMQFPPKPPHPELPMPAKEYFIDRSTHDARLVRSKMKPELSDTSCNARQLEPMTAADIAQLASLVGHPLGKEEKWHPEAPLLVDNIAHLKQIIQDCETELVVLNFFATWSMPCEAMDPLYRVLSKRTPIARFLKIDVDDCDTIANKVNIATVPSVCIFRLAKKEDRTKEKHKKRSNYGLGEALATIAGFGRDGGIEFRTKFIAFIAELATEEELTVTKKYGLFDEFDSLVKAIGIQAPSNVPTTNPDISAKAKAALEIEQRQSIDELSAAAEELHMTTTKEEVEALAFQPLKAFESQVVWRSGSDVADHVHEKIPFDLHHHDSAGNAVAKSMLQRLENDMQAWSKTAVAERRPEVKILQSTLVQRYFSATGDATQEKADLANAKTSLRKLLADLRAARDRDSLMVQEMLPLLTRASNYIDLGAPIDDDDFERSRKDSASRKQLRKDSKRRQERLKYIMRRACGQEPEVWIEFLFGALLSSGAVKDLQRLNPFLPTEVVNTMLKMVSLVVLRSNRIGHINRCVGSGLKLLSLVEQALALDSESARSARADALVPSLCQASETMAGNLAGARAYISKNDFTFDPRYLIFEFTWNIMLRRKQVEIVNMFMENLKQGNSKVKQMIMGAGKTTVVAPLLALMLADGKSLVLSVVPKALLEMSRKRMRETFATIMQKRVYTLKFDRSTEIKPSMFRSLENATRNRGIVVATPTAVKSIMLSYIENLGTLEREERSGQYTKAEVTRSKVDELGRVLRLFKHGSMLLDEVDLILHPLKSELNFPVGEKFDLDVSEHGERWGLPIHLLDSIFFAATGKICTFEQRGSALDILRRLAAKIERGYQLRALQKLPHVTLLNNQYYHRELKPLLAEWAYLWLQKEHLHGVDHQEAIQYILQGAASRSETATKVTNLEKELKRARAMLAGDLVGSDLAESTSSSSSLVSSSNLEHEAEQARAEMEAVEREMEMTKSQVEKVEFDARQAFETAADDGETASVSKRDSKRNSLYNKLAALAKVNSSNGKPTDPPSRLSWITSKAGKRFSLTRSRSSSNPAFGDPTPREEPATPLEKVEALVRRTEEAYKSAEEHSRLTDLVYQVQEEYESFLEQSGVRMGTLQSKIVSTTLKIEEAQYPRDDSLDNAAVVWLATRVDAGGGLGGGSSSESGGLSAPPSSSVIAQCGKLEDLGFSVKVTDEVEEAMKRARDLLEKGQLRCLIVGGGEQIERGCGKDCDMIHNTDCLRCGEHWNSHSGHECRSLGQRGSWLLEIEDPTEDLDVSEVVQTALYEKGQKPIPNSRLFVFAGHRILPEWERMSCWDDSITVTDSPDTLLQLVEQVEEYQDLDVVDDDDVSSVSSDHSFLDGFTSDEDADAETKPAKSQPKDSKDEKQPKLERPTFVRQASAGTLRLQRLKTRLEKLESKKANFSRVEERERKSAKTKVSDAFSQLRVSIDKRVTQLRKVLGQHVSHSSGALTSRVLKRLQNVADGNQDDLDPTSWSKSRINYGYEAARALAYLDTYLFDPNHVESLKEAQSCMAVLDDEWMYLEHIALAAKVMANVSLHHKKLLNLTFDWLKTFMPHCLAKINRVSFGLLNEEDCEQALELDPLMPRSRLKLAVPFVGKDVPSASSEFAHPDVIVGLTILAYRYSGLRRTDFDDVVDGLTTDYSHEIGPASERPSTQRHELWVREAGGHIRGLKQTKTTTGQGGAPRRVSGQKKHPLRVDPDEEEDEDEVVQLKYLQKSNREQTSKLFKLWKTEPHVIHHYLNHFIFPSHMRSQKLKISASGQAVGGDMLIGHRMGFSGTPSDLLPKELGKCDYETGDDGKMLSTVLDSRITSFEHMENNWSVENLLERIATAEPRFNALIDTGALITGYSNQEVAATLLKLGLAWCDGVVFLDSQDRQQVLVRATDRVVSADQCGIPVEKRFAFYDQIHTTGMDISHVVNARAVVTLGKDMVFRDYVQGVYRMRGIGKGQKVTVFIIPEVLELMHRELQRGVKYSLNTNTSNSDQVKVLVDICAWLIINSMRSEQVQWSMLCQQNIANIYRKNAFRRLMLQELSEDSIDSGKEKDDSQKRDRSASNASKASARKQDSDKAVQVRPKASEIRGYLPQELAEKVLALSFKDCAKVFDEPVDFSLEATVPDPVPFADKLSGMLDAQAHLLLGDEQHKAGNEILAEVRYYSEQDGEDMSQRLESEQEREQEQEQEKEVKAKRDQQIEVEKFVDREYSRANESPSSWPLKLLAHGPPAQKKATQDHPFNRLSTFKLRHQEPLKFPSYLYFSNNYFNPDWNSLRRVKNVVMVLEWAPSASAVEAIPPAECRQQHVLSPQGEIALEKAYRLLAARTGELSPKDVFSTIQAAADIKVTETQLSDIMTEFGNERGALDQNGLRELLTSGILRQVERGRYFVAVSLAEAQTIKRILHVTRGNSVTKGHPLIKGADTELALRYTPLTSFGTTNTFLEEGIVFDASRGWTKPKSMIPHTRAPKYQSSVAHNCMRFLDCSMHYNEAALNVLIRSLQENIIHERERFFFTTIGCRRRMERKWQETPIAKVFTVADEWVALKQRAQAVFIREAIEAKKLTLWEAFTAFDADDNGVLSPAEFYGAVRWLGIPDMTPEDVVDMIEAADRNRDGQIDYKEYLEMLHDPDAEVDDDEFESAAAQHAEQEPGSKHSKPVVDPYGADILREVMMSRKRDELQRQREDRLKRQAYQKSIDIKVFEEELHASKSRVGGPNPRLYREGQEGTVIVEPEAEEDPSTREEGATSLSLERSQVCEYVFNTYSKPLRMGMHGQCKFTAMYGGSQLLTPGAMRSRSMVRDDRGHQLSKCNNYWCHCDSCSTRNTSYVCWSCDYYLCKKCYKRQSDEAKKFNDNVAEAETYMDCTIGSSFTLQIPAAVSQQERILEKRNSTSLELVSTVADLATLQATDVTCHNFTISLEIRIEKLPSKGQLAALLRFSPSQLGRSRRRNQASVYIDEHGFLTDGSPMDPELVQQLQIAAGESDQNTNAETKEVEDESGDKEQDKVIEATEKSNKKEKSKKSSKNEKPKYVHVSAKTWHMVSIVVDARHGTMSAYVDGKFCTSMSDLHEEDIMLQHQLTVFGGAKQGHLRGGGVRRILVHSRKLDVDAIRRVEQYAANERKLNVVWCDLNKNGFHDTAIKNLSRNGIEIVRCHTLSDTLKIISEKFENRVHCVVTTVDEDLEENEEGQFHSKAAEILALDGKVVEQKKEETDNAVAVGEQSNHCLGVRYCQLLRERFPKVPLVLDTCVPKHKDKKFIEGEQVRAKFKGKKYFPGVITKVHKGGESYDVEYDDGDVETEVKAAWVKPFTSDNKRRNNRNTQLSEVDLEECIALDILVTGSLEHLEELVGTSLAKRPPPPQLARVSDESAKEPLPSASVEELTEEEEKALETVAEE